MQKHSSFSYTAGANVNKNNVLAMLQDQNNWKKTKKNSYSIWATIVQPGVNCYNNLEDCKYTTNEQKCVILSGTRGEQWVTTLDKLAKTYYFTNSISALENLPKRPIDASNASSTLVDESQIINAKSLKARANRKRLLPWTSITTIPVSGDYTNYCFHLPTSVKNFPVTTSWGETLLANRDGIDHGIGDFILCSKTPDGRPNINDVWVVNGNVFMDTYNKRNIRGIPDELSKRLINAPKPTKEYIEMPNAANLDTVVSSKETKQKTSGAPRRELEIVSKYTVGHNIVAYDIKDGTGKIQRVDKNALFWLVGRGQIKGVTVQIRGNTIGLLAKDGYSLDNIKAYKLQSEEQ